MATAVWALRLWRAAPRGEAGWRFTATSPASQRAPKELIEMQNDLFNKEKNRQLSLTPRTEKIEVKHVGKTDPGTVFVMNKNISTPYSCAMHLSEWYCRKSILALVDGQPWDMYKPLTKSCEIKFLTFKDHDPGEVNKAYWRSCAMMMGCVIERAFKDEYMVSLVRAPAVPVVAGAFCYDVVLDKRLDEWMPSKENLRSFTKDACALIYKDLPFETLEVDAKVALEIFQHNKYKIDFVEEKASQNPERIVTLHRFGDFIDVSEGPLIPRTSICSQYQVSAAHNLQATQTGLIRRFQGLSLPVHLRAHFTVWHKLLERSRKMLAGTLSSVHHSAFQAYLFLRDSSSIWTSFPLRLLFTS
ncbi:PREDICTED: 39S ribosomal protein L39, mitochondrial isoform X1 [Hipposideros armiger]|uniref:Large ribosomal subunit protein mL39 n=1 Tax=Hipposideros armiger TaxID=186990 RepID=A0A8B7SVY7_HIPAR|nr:PREDICTED: 39S ribosomal protein L39, mitochondrial isoform X1 [Hipposideros armiger]